MSDKSHAETQQHESEHATRFEEGNTGAHELNDSKDSRTIANKLAAAEQNEKLEAEAEEHKLRPTEIALSHGNEPSRGAKIDQRIEDEEREELERKGKA